MPTYTYWLDLFTGETWDEFLANGAGISGFRENQRTRCKKIKIGDRFLCYVTGISRFIGVLEVRSKVFEAQDPIWSRETFPIRFEVEPLIYVTYEESLPVLEFRDRLKVFEGLQNPNFWSGAFRGSPRKFPFEDGEFLTKELTLQKQDPVLRPVDTKKLYGRKVQPPVVETEGEEAVTIPEPEAFEEDDKSPAATEHTEIQYLLVKVGNDMGLDVHVARNDRGKQFKGRQFTDFPRLRQKLDLPFDPVTNRTIELIDVLWLRDDTIVAAFEIESTTSIYSGLLRMSDLISKLGRNMRIPLFVVAQDERRDKVLSEVNRPTFSKLPIPLKDVCRYISFADLKQQIESSQHLLHRLKPEFIYEDVSESCELEDA